MNPAEHFKLDPASPIPLYRQLRSSIQTVLQSGEWSSERALPSERELCESLSLARATVRQANMNSSLTVGWCAAEDWAPIQAPPKSSSHWRELPVLAKTCSNRD